VRECVRESVCVRESECERERAVLISVVSKESDRDR